MEGEYPWAFRLTRHTAVEMGSHLVSVLCHMATNTARIQVPAAAKWGIIGRGGLVMDGNKWK